MTRRRLPDRRPSVSFLVTWKTEAGDHHFTLTAGYDPGTGDLSEVFYSDGQKSGAALQHTVQDSCILISVALQHGVPLAELARSIGRAPLFGAVVPASPIGAILDALEGVR